jgi:hypothetical protein
MKIKINHLFHDANSNTDMCEDCFSKINGNQDQAIKKIAKHEGDARTIEWLNKFSANFKNANKEDSEMKCMCGKTFFKVSF